MSNLIIVESPAKAKTIKKYVGKGYEVVASMGHLRDLPKSVIGVDIKNDFEPKYINIKGKGPIIKNIKKYASKSDKIFLATDPDREGEAISWHLMYILGLSSDKKNRITFNEITKSGVKYGMAHPRKIDKNLVDAQQARRVLDRLVGYKLSPFLWKNVRPGLSAGRVQSVAVMLIVDRELEIRKFNPKEFWTIDATLKKTDDSIAFPAHVVSKNGEQIEIEDEILADKILADLKEQCYIVTKVKKGSRKRSPYPPFTTSTMQQESHRKLNFQSARTMKVAQQLYEGLTVEGYGSTGLITYMRTDSLRISDDAINSARAYISKKFGKEYIPERPRTFKSKNKSQDGHEAIRPTMPELDPEKVKNSLNNEQYKLYKLIWQRFMSSQSTDAIYSTVSLEIQSGDYCFRTSGSTIKFPGFTSFYDTEDKPKNVLLPKLRENDCLELKKLEKNQHFTKPPANYTEASLTKTLEELGIGRPSTYVPTITTILKREYVTMEKKNLKPTILGEAITNIMKDSFNNIINVSFTAKIEEEFDKISEGKLFWKNSIREFYDEFNFTLRKAEENSNIKKYKPIEEPTDEVCEKCGKAMIIKHGRFGKFMACSGYPECKNTKKIVNLTKGICPDCGGKIIKQKSSKGHVFYGCNNYPSCKFVSWDEPVSDICPKCSNTMFRKKNKKNTIYCANKKCQP